MHHYCELNCKNELPRCYIIMLFSTTEIKGQHIKMKIDELGWNSLPWGGIHNNIIQRLITNYCHCHGQGHQAHTCKLHLCTLTMLVSLGSIMLISWNEFWCSSSADVWCWIMLVSVGELEIKCIYLESKAENSIGNSTIKCHYLIPESSSSSSSVLDTSSLSNILNSSILTTLTVFLPLFYSIYSEGFWGWVHNDRTLSSQHQRL